MQKTLARRKMPSSSTRHKNFKNPAPRLPNSSLARNGKRNRAQAEFDALLAKA
jgi:hypothetical protein